MCHMDDVWARLLRYFSNALISGYVRGRLGEKDQLNVIMEEFSTSVLMTHFPAMDSFLVSSLCLIFPSVYKLEH